MLKTLQNQITSKITRKRLSRFLHEHSTNEKVLNLGVGKRNYSDIFPNTVSLDISSDVKPDVIGDAHDLHMFPKEQFTTVMSCELLEHLHNPFKGIEEIARVLKPGGKLILTTRFIFPLHDTPNDYFRFTKYGLKSMLEPYFDNIEIREEAGSLETIAILFQRIGFQTKTLGTTFLKIFWHILAKLTMFASFLVTKEYGDLTMENEEKSIMTSGYYVTATKKRKS